jgi:periplasmic glucans biosynthesis protein
MILYQAAEIPCLFALTPPNFGGKTTANFRGQGLMDRRQLLGGVASAVFLLVQGPANAQNRAPQAPPAQPPAAPPATPQARFTFEEVVRRAREMATMAHETPAALPDTLAKLDFDTWRDIRFRPDRALLQGQGSNFRLQTFHPGFLYTRPVTINLIREGVAAPIPYAANLFDYGRNRFERPLPVNTGFAGFRLHYPLNDPRVHDELVSFLGASYFRFLGEGQKYGLSARGLSIGVGAKETEEFPVFREFWLEQPEAGSDRAVIYALLDSESVTGAYRFDIYAAKETVVEVTAMLFARKRIDKLGIAPLTSMFFTGENDRRYADDFRPELHDSDGLLIHTGAGEWIWRPLRNPTRIEAAAFMDSNVRGFGLMQRDRAFEHYQDLDLNYELRPSYWVEPLEGWGEGKIELFEIPTSDETNDNIVAQWAPLQPMEAGHSRTWRYKITATMDEGEITPGGVARNTYRTKPKALGSAEPVTPTMTRFIIDFTDGQLPFFAKAADQVQVVPSISGGRIVRTFLIPNPQTGGFRAGIDVDVPAGQSADIRAFLRAGNKTLTETWTYPWRPE